MEHAHLYCIKVDEKWGFINDQGHMVVDPEYDRVGEYGDERLIPVLKNNHIGLLGPDGNIARSCNIAYAGWYYWFSEGLLAVNDKNGKWGYIDTKGETVIEAQYDCVGEFKYGMGRVIQGKKKMYVNRHNEVVLHADKLMWHFSCGRARICTQEQDDDPLSRFGFIDVSGKIIVPIMYYQAAHLFFNDRVAVSDEVLVDKSGDPEYWYKLIDVDGNAVTGTEYQHINPFFHANASYIREERGRTVCGVLTRDGKRLIESRRMEFHACSDRIICFTRTRDEQPERQGIMDLQGNVLLEPKGRRTFSCLKNGFMAAILCDEKDEDNDFWEYFTEDGRQLTHERFYHANEFNHGMALALVDEERHAYVNREGRVFHWNDYK